MKANQEPIQIAISYIEDHLKDTLNIGELADIAGFSKYHFTRLFKEQTGMSPYDYYRGRKVTQALTFMQENQSKIIDVAYEFGFNSPEVFTRSCLSAFGESPSQLKKSMQNSTFKGIAPFTLARLEQYSQYKSLSVDTITLPSIILKGYLYSSKSSTAILDWKSPSLQSLIRNSHESPIYQLHWKHTDPEKYNHLVGIIMNPNNDMEDESSVTDMIYKKIPANDYLCFPLINNRKELDEMRNYIYDYYLPKERGPQSFTYEVEAFRFDSQLLRPKDGLLYIPSPKSVRHQQ